MNTAVELCGVVLVRVYYALLHEKQYIADIVAGKTSIDRQWTSADDCHCTTADADGRESQNV